MERSKSGKQLAIFILWRVLAVCLTLFFILLISNIVFYVVPGDPARIMLGTNAREEEVEALRELLGLNRPWISQITSYMSGLFRGDLGQSMRFSRPVAELLTSRIPLTILLSFEALLIALVFGIPLALLAARKPGGVLDTAVSVLTQVGLAIPSFFSAILLTLLMAVLFQNFGGVQYVPPSNGLLLSMRSLLLPAIAIAIPRIAWVVSFLKQSLTEQRRMDYVRTARGKGLSTIEILIGHVFRNALVPLVTTMGIVLAELFAGAIVVEQVYNLPGIGRLLVTAIESRDFPLTQGVILVIAFLVVIVGLIVDLINQAIDPRLRFTTVKKGGV